MVRRANMYSRSVTRRPAAHPPVRTRVGRPALATAESHRRPSGLAAIKPAIDIGED
jgi:hypothetical protein